jgi:hypothetical protein
MGKIVMDLPQTQKANSYLSLLAACKTVIPSAALTSFPSIWIIISFIFFAFAVYSQRVG